MIWYPYAQMKTLKSPKKIIDAQGVYLKTKDKSLIDSISSWWCMIHGYKNPELNQAMKNQIDKFSHCMLAGLCHDSVEELSEKLESYLPGDLNHFFFSDSGSVAVEVALKMAVQFNRNRGQKRKKILALKNAYHGDTFMTMAVGDDEDYHSAFPKNPDVIHVPTEIPDLEKVFSQCGNNLICFIVEPLLQGAGGIRMYDLAFLKKARELCDKYDVILIFDEVATGFGRTGHRFVSDLVLPDILVLGKALTGGYIGHALTAANKKVFDGFYGDDPSLAFMHGPTFMANPVACALALKSIEIFERENYISKIANIEKTVRRELSGFEDERIKEIRVMGAAFCIEVKESETLKGFADFAYDRGVFARPFVRYMYGMVPYIITEEQLVTITDTMKAWFQK
ncbi:MAG: adenosylmethionine--8-amino-7-oxononanoate transaminase [Treponema sp.]|nr:adenosylmethionine--8-amino-7-oxononanoate transaminase [Treponema sp.]